MEPACAREAQVCQTKTVQYVPLSAADPNPVRRTKGCYSANREHPIDLDWIQEICRSSGLFGCCAAPILDGLDQSC